jgi:hypothetical protein
VLALLPERAQGQAARSTVPILVPRNAALLSGATIVAKEYYFSFSAGADGVFVTIQGTRLAHRYEAIGKITGDRAIRGTRGFVTMNEGIKEASWIENGASYTVDVECVSQQDQRCIDDRFLLDTTSSLAYVGGDRGAQP